MPIRPLRPCPSPGCRELLPPGVRYCSAHTRAVNRGYDSLRPPRSQRGYDTAHYKLRKLVMAEQPLCPMCEAAGRIVIGVDMDHIDGDVTNRSRDNLQMLCKSCHSRKTVTENGGMGRVSGTGRVRWAY